MGEVENCTAIGAFNSTNFLIVYSILEVIGVSILVAASLLAWFYAKEHKKLIYLQYRTSASVVLFSMATIFLLLFSTGVRIPKEYSFFVSCALGNTSYLSFPILFLAGLMVEVLSFGFKAKLRIQLANAEKQKETISKWLWYTDQPSFSNSLALFFGILCFITAVGASIATCPDLGANRCKLIDARDGKALIIFFVLALIAAVQTIYIYRKLLTFPDPFSILIEVRRFTILTFLAVLLNIVLALVFVEDLEQTESLNYSPLFLGNFVYYAIFCYMVPYQVYKAFKFTKTKEPFKQFDLLRVLNDKAGHDLLKQYLIYEFSVENILFMDAVEEIKTIQDDTRCIAHMRIIYDEFIASRRLNLSSTTYNFLDNAFKGRGEEVLSPDIFKTAYGEIFTLVEFDAFHRFKRSKAFKMYVGVETAEVSL